MVKHNVNYFFGLFPTLIIAIYVLILKSAQYKIKKKNLKMRKIFINF